MHSSTFSPERLNFLRRSFQTLQWKDGIRVLTNPGRVAFYRAVRSLVRLPKPMPTRRRSLLQGAIPLAPSFATAQNPWLARFDDLNLVYCEVGEQLRGLVRLAGAYRSAYAAPSGNDSDPENEHAWHRLYWALRFARAAATEHEEAASALRRELSNYLASDYSDCPFAMTPYTASERIGSLAEILYWMGFRDRQDQQSLANAIEQRIFRDAEYVRTHVERGLGVHNHVLNNARALYLASALLEGCSDAAAWREEAFQLWQDYFPRLVLDDGAFAEQSSHYHLLLSRTALEYSLAARRWNQPLPGDLRLRFARMFRLSNDLLRPDGSLPRFGDNSPDRTVEDLWGLNGAAWHHALLDEVPRHRMYTFLTHYYCDRRPELPAAANYGFARIYPTGGYAFLRSATGDVELAAHGDPGPEIRAHGDAGRGSFELWWRGHVIIREPGSRVAVCRDDDGNRGSESQNVTCFDGLGPAIDFRDRDCVSPWYAGESGSWHQPANAVVQFRCEAYRRFKSDLGVVRTWRLTNDSLFFEEHAEGEGVTEVVSRLFLGSGNWGPLNWNIPVGEGAICWNDGSSSALKMSVRTPRGFRASIEAGRCLPEYGAENRVRVLCIRGRAVLPFHWKVSVEFSGGLPLPEFFRSAGEVMSCAE